MVKVETLKEDGFVRILRCREDNRIGYQMWLTDLEKGCIDRYFLDMEVKAWWLINLQRWYVFFYEKNGRRVRGAFCKNGPGWLICLGSFCEHVGCGISRYALNTRSQNFLVLKMCICLQGTP